MSDSRPVYTSAQKLNMDPVYTRLKKGKHYSGLQANQKVDTGLICTRIIEVDIGSSYNRLWMRYLNEIQKGIYYFGLH